MAHSFAAFTLVMMTSASIGERIDPLIADFINSLRTTTITPRSCGVQKECVPFYRCKTADSADSTCEYPDTCCDISDVSTTPDHHGACGYQSSLTGNAEQETDFGDYPWLATLMTEKEAVPENFFCSGVIITPTAVLTTAYCAGLAPQDFFVQAGEWLRMDKTYFQHRARRVTKLITHESYDEASLTYNLALLIVESPFQWEVNVRPVCLPGSKDNYDELRCYVPSYTKDKPFLPGSNAILKKVNSPVVPKDRCLATYILHLSADVQIPDTDICAGGKEDKDYDINDNGAPLVCPVLDEEERYIVVGIASFFPQEEDINNKSYIPRNVPREYVSIPLLLQWIKEKLTQNNIAL